MNFPTVTNKGLFYSILKKNNGHLQMVFILFDYFENALLNFPSGNLKISKRLKAGRGKVGSKYQLSLR